MTGCAEIAVAAYFVVGSIRRAAFLRNDGDPVLLEDKTVQAIAQEVKATPAQVPHIGMCLLLEACHCSPDVMLCDCITNHDRC